MWIAYPLLPMAIKLKIASIDASAGLRARPMLFGGIAAGMLLACAALLALALTGVRTHALAFAGLRPHTLPELVEMAKTHPKDASIQVDLGDAYFAAGRRIPALNAYDKALQLDRTAVTSRMTGNLVSCYGTREMGAAGAIITQYKLADTEAGLRALIPNGKWRVRNGALNTLDGLGKAKRADFLTVYTLDLASTDCDIRRSAVEKLGHLGDKRALDEIRAAARKDDANTPWYAFSCLGDRPEDAEQRILASR